MPGEPTVGGIWDSELIGSDHVLARLVTKYLELAEACYRVQVAVHDRGGRFRKGHHVRQPHPAVLKKADLDQALTRVYQRFFEPGERMSTSTSNSRRQGRETRTASASPPPSAPSRSE